MGHVMSSVELCEKAVDIATNYKTLYVMGCFGAPLNEANKKRYTKNHSYNRQATRTKMINAATDDTFGFDCVNLIKGILWGWSGNTELKYGGAKYGSNGVPDVNSSRIMNYCTEESTDFTDVVPGEVLHMEGHVGLYIGDGRVVECTPSWENKVQITKLSDRKWLSHGKMKWVNYVDTTPKFIAKKDYAAYNFSVDAVSGSNPVGVVEKGEYFIYKVYGSSINVSKKSGVSGYWIMP